MRLGRNSKVVKVDNKLVGFNLGSDFCAEHEWGISKILNTFNVNQNKIGVDRRTVTRVPNCLIFMLTIFNDIKCYFLGLLPFCRTIEDVERVEKSLNYLDLTDIRGLKENGMIAAWDDHSFAILVTETYENELRELHDAFINLDIVIGISNKELFKNGGLTLSIKSNLPEEVTQSMKDADLDKIALEKAAKKTKIEKLLKKAGKQYLALSPRWKDESKTEVIFWLNPYHQDVDNFGWFTVEDLKDWIKGTGKIPRTLNQ